MLFELIAERYERKSIAITANTPFSQWGEVFVDAGHDGGRGGPARASLDDPGDERGELPTPHRASRTGTSRNELGRRQLQLAAVN